IDIDPQGNSSSWMGININELHKSMFNVFHDNLPINEILHETSIENMWVVPSNVSLAAIERTLANKLENDTILKKSISPLLYHFDYIILDCPPSLGLLTVNALSAVKEVIIPLETKVLALNGLVTLINTVNLVKDTLNPSLEVTGIIACMFDIRTNLSNKVVEKIKEKFHDKLFKSIIRESTQLAECPISSLPITRYAPDSRGAQDYMDLAREVIEGEKEVARFYEEDAAEASRHFDAKDKEAGQQSDDDEAEIDHIEAEAGWQSGEEKNEADRQDGDIQNEVNQRYDDSEKGIDQQYDDGVEEGESGTGHYADEVTEDVDQQNVHSEKEKGQHSGGVEAEAGSQFNDEKNEVDRQYNDGEDEIVKRFGEVEREAGSQFDEEKKEVDRQDVSGEDEIGKRYGEVKTETGSQFDEEKKEVDQRFGEGEKEE
ncbi:MAG: AAA family ATPase, partial [Candidatus Scalindua sp.]